MDSVKALVTESQTESLHQLVDTGTDRYLSYTRLVGEKWVVGVTDGVDVWRSEFGITDLDTNRDLADVNTLDAYLSRFRSSFTSGDIHIGREGFLVSLKIGRGAKALEFELYEAKAAERKMELQAMLFCMAEKSSELSAKLQSANSKIDNLKQQQPSGAAALFDLDSKKSKSQAKPAAKKVGMSMVNPSSKKRKAAQGIVFD